MVVVYSTSPCVKCDATKRALNKAGIAFEERSAENHPDVVEEARAEELARTGQALTAPIVVVGDGRWWCGYRPDRIKALEADMEYEKRTNAGLTELAQSVTA